MNLQLLYIKQMHLILYKDNQWLNTQNFTLALYNSAVSYSYNADGCPLFREHTFLLQTLIYRITRLTAET
jgi:hypothetical protein